MPGIKITGKGGGQNTVAGYPLKAGDMAGRVPAYSDVGTREGLGGVNRNAKAFEEKYKALKQLEIDTYNKANLAASRAKAELDKRERDSAERRLREKETNDRKLEAERNRLAIQVTKRAEAERNRAERQHAVEQSRAIKQQDSEQKKQQRESARDPARKMAQAYYAGEQPFSKLATGALVTDYKAALAEERHIRKTYLTASEKEKAAEERKVEKERVQEERRIIRETKQAERARIQEERKVEREKVAYRRGMAYAASRGAMFGAVLGEIGRGNLSNAAREVAAAGGGAIGGGIGFALGGPTGGMIGRVAGAILGEFASYLLDAPKAVLGAAQPAADLQTKAYALGRAGRFSGGKLYDLFGPDKAGAQPWMATYGTDPFKVMKSLEALGPISLPGSGGAMDLAQTIAKHRISGAYSNLPEGVIEKILGQGMGLGLASPNAGSASKYLTDFSRIFEVSSARGFDRSRLMESMTSALESIAKTGTMGVNKTALTDTMMRFAATGTPGGVTGQTFANFVGAQANNFQNITGNNLAMTALMGNPAFTNALKTKKGVLGLIGGMGNLPKGVSPEYANTLIGLINDAANKGSYPQAAGIFMSRLAQPGSAAANQLFQTMIPSMTGDQKYLAPYIFGPMATGNNDLGQALDYMYGPPALQGTGATSAFVGRNETTVRAAQSMMDQLMKMGLSPKAAAGVVGSLMQESSLNPRAHNDIKGGHDGLPQWDRSRWAEAQRFAGTATPKSSQQLAKIGYDLTKGKYAALGKRLNAAPSAAAAAEMFSLGKGSYEQTDVMGKRGIYAESFLNDIQNIPLKTQTLQADAGSNSLFLANKVLTNLAPIAINAANDLDKLAAAIRQLGQAPAAILNTFGKGAGIPSNIQRAMP